MLREQRPEGHIKRTMSPKENPTLSDLEPWDKFFPMANLADMWQIIAQTWKRKKYKNSASCYHSLIVYRTTQYSPAHSARNSESRFFPGLVWSGRAAPVSFIDHSFVTLVLRQKFYLKIAGGRNPRPLKFVHLNVLETKYGNQCAIDKGYGTPPNLNNFLCAGNVIGEDTCQGDSGGACNLSPLKCVAINMVVTSNVKSSGFGGMEAFWKVTLDAFDFSFTDQMCSNKYRTKNIFKFMELRDSVLTQFWKVKFGTTFNRRRSRKVTWTNGITLSY